MKSRSERISWKYLGFGLTFGILIGIIMQTPVWGMVLGLAIGLTWDYAKNKRHKR